MTVLTMARSHSTFQQLATAIPALHPTFRCPSLHSWAFPPCPATRTSLSSLSSRRDMCLMRRLGRTLRMSTGWRSSPRIRQTGGRGAPFNHFLSFTSCFSSVVISSGLHARRLRMEPMFGDPCSSSSLMGAAWSGAIRTESVSRRPKSMQPSNSSIRLLRKCIAPTRYPANR